MSYSTQPAFIHFGSWDDETRSHPAMKWMESYTKEWIDAKAFDKPASEMHMSDFSIQKSDGTVIEGAEPAWKTAAEIYAPFSGHSHDPKFLVCWDTNDGWGMAGVADVFFNLHGSSGGAIADPQGVKWDGVNAGAFTFLYVKEGGGIKLKETKIFSDPSPALSLMVKKGMLNGEQLAGMLSA